MIVLFSCKQQEGGLIEFLKFWKYIIAGSGQLVNKQKSALFFSDNCEDVVKEEVMQALQIPTEALGESYLGLPTAIGKVTYGIFNYVPERIQNFVNGWGEDFLSCPGREVLIKANT
jgi:hypothetical protein